MEGKPIISIKEARKILGKEASKLSDDEIRSLLEAFDDIATLIIRNYKVPKTNATP